MAPAFSKEAILCGSIDHLCLVCERYLRTERDVCQHISTPGHRQNLDSTGYVEKYKNERIRKVKRRYYCEFCNVLVSTITAIGFHVEEPRHKENKSSQMIGRVDEVIVFEDIAIQEEAWHGFIDKNTCTLCNVEYEDKDEHKSEPAHVVNLIRNKVINDNNNVYRKIDESTFHCLTCNAIVVEITAHLEHSNHKELLQMCMTVTPSNQEENIKKYLSVCDHDEVNNVTHIADKAQYNMKGGENISETLNAKDYMTCDSDGKISCNVCNCDVHPFEVKNHIDGLPHQKMLKRYKKSDASTTNAKNTKDDQYASDILDSISKFQKNNIDINFESRSAVCRKCSMNLKFCRKEIENHIEEHKNNIERKAAGTAVISNNLFLKDKNENKTKKSETLFTSPVFRTPKNDNNENVNTIPTQITKLNGGDNEIQKTAEEHGFTYICTSNKVHCQSCNKYIPSAVGKIIEHANGEIHKTNVKLFNKSLNSNGNEIVKKINAEKCKFQRVPSNRFISTAVNANNVLEGDIVVNKRYCIDFVSFMFLTIAGPMQMRCQCCEVNLHMQDAEKHLNNIKHKTAVIKEVKLVLCSDSEFIREIRPETFHCGFCNIVVDSWHDMEEHLKSVDHKDKKIFANWRLAQHLPEIERRKRVEQIERQIQQQFLMSLLS